MRVRVAEVAEQLLEVMLVSEALSVSLAPVNMEVLPTDPDTGSSPANLHPPQPCAH